MYDGVCEYVYVRVRARMLVCVWASHYSEHDGPVVVARWRQADSSLCIHSKRVVPACDAAPARLIILSEQYITIHHYKCLSGGR